MGLSLELSNCHGRWMAAISCGVPYTWYLKLAADLTSESGWIPQVNIVVGSGLTNCPFFRLWLMIGIKVNP